MNKLAVVGLCTLGTAIIGSVIYLTRKKKPSTEESHTSIQGDLLKTTVFDVEFNQPLIKDLLNEMTPSDAAHFTHSYLYIKKKLRAELSAAQYQEKLQTLLSVLLYACGKKLDRNHPDRNLLGETARLIKEEIWTFLDQPNYLFTEAAREVEAALIRGEGPEIFALSA